MNFNAKSTIFGALTDPNAYYFSGMREKILDSRGGRRYGTLKKIIKQPTGEQMTRNIVRTTKRLMSPKTPTAVGTMQLIDTSSAKSRIQQVKWSDYSKGSVSGGGPKLDTMITVVRRPNINCTPQTVRLAVRTAKQKEAPEFLRTMMMHCSSPAERRALQIVGKIAPNRNVVLM